MINVLPTSQVFQKFHSIIVSAQNYHGSLGVDEVPGGSSVSIVPLYLKTCELKTSYLLPHGQYTAGSIQWHNIMQLLLWTLWWEMEDTFLQF